MQQELILDELGARRVDYFRAETFVLKQFQEMEALSGDR